MAEKERGGDGGQVASIAPVAPLGGVDGNPNVPAPSPQAELIRAPGGGDVTGGSPLDLGKTVADHVGEVLHGKHLSKDRMIVMRHARFKSDRERMLLAVAEGAVGWLGDAAYSANPEVFRQAMGRAEELEKEGRNGWGYYNEFVSKSGNLATFGVLRRVLDTYVNASHADNGKAADSIEVVAKSFGGEEAEEGRIAKLKGLFGKGGK